MLDRASGHGGHFDGGTAPPQGGCYRSAGGEHAQRKDAAARSGCTGFCHRHAECRRSVATLPTTRENQEGASLTGGAHWSFDLPPKSASKSAAALVLLTLPIRLPENASSILSSKKLFGEGDAISCRNSSGDTALYSCTHHRWQIRSPSCADARRSRRRGAWTISEVCDPCRDYASAVPLPRRMPHHQLGRFNDIQLRHRANKMNKVDFVLY